MQPPSRPRSRWLLPAAGLALLLGLGLLLLSDVIRSGGGVAPPEGRTESVVRAPPVAPPAEQQLPEVLAAEPIPAADFHPQAGPAADFGTDVIVRNAGKVDGVEPALAGVRLSLVSGRQRFEAAATALDGRAHIDWSALPAEWSDERRPLALLASRPGFTPSCRPLTSPRPRFLELSLAPAAHLDGRVVWSSFDAGLPVGRSLRVLAWPLGHRLEEDDLDPAAEPLPPALACRTALDGSFVLDGLEPETTYQVLASGPGCVPAGTVTARPPHDWSGLPLTPRVDRLYGCVLRLVETGGAPLRAAEYTFGRRGFGWSEDFPESGRCELFPERDLALAGVDVAALHVNGWSDHALWMVAPPSLESAGPMTFHADVPGYEPGETRVFAAATQNGVPDVVLALQPRAAAFASVQLVFDGALPRRPASTMQMPDATLHLRSTDGLDVHCRIPLVSGEGLTLDGVPVGEYSALLSLTHAFIEELAPVTAAPLRVDTLHTERVVFQLGAVGNVSCRLLRPDGSSSDGPAWLRLVRLTEGPRTESRLLSFVEWPYVVPNLPTGRYEVHWLEAAPSLESHVVPVEVEVVDQGISGVTLAAP